MATATDIVTEIPPELPDTDRTVATGHPTGFWFIFTGELAERASFYGMKAVLLFYLIDVFRYENADASTMVHLYVAGCYLTALIGGLLADRYLNKYWVIVAFSVPYVIGQFIVGLSNQYLMFGGLVLLAFGSGIIKPNISTLMGLTYDQQRPGQEQLRTQAFSMFYVAINLGSFLSTLICPALRNYFGEVDPETNRAMNPQAGYFAAFLFPAVLMTVALVIFALGKKYYATEPLGYKQRREESATSPEEQSAKWKVVGQLFGLFFLVMFFWAIFDQHTSTWGLFAKDYLDLDLSFAGLSYTVPPDQIQAINPLLIVIFVPIVNVVFWALASRGYKVRATDKIILGFLLTAATMGIHALAGYIAVQPDGTVQRVSILWQILAYLAITNAEILISITGLELAFTAAPKSMKGFITSIWLLFIGMANLLIDAPVTRLYPGKGSEYAFTTPTGYFGMLTVAMLAVTVAFVFVARQFNRSRAS